MPANDFLDTYLQNGEQVVEQHLIINDASVLVPQDAICGYHSDTSTVSRFCFRLKYGHPLSQLLLVGFVDGVEAVGKLHLAEVDVVVGPFYHQVYLGVRPVTLASPCAGVIGMIELLAKSTKKILFW